MQSPPRHDLVLLDELGKLEEDYAESREHCRGHCTYNTQCKVVLSLPLSLCLSVCVCVIETFLRSGRIIVRWILCLLLLFVTIQTQMMKLAMTTTVLERLGR